MTEGPNDLGVFHLPAAADGLRRGIIMGMTCRWCEEAMDIVASTDPDAECVRNPQTGEVRTETVGLLCPTCDAPASPKDLW